MLKGTYKFVKATWADSPDDNDNTTIDEMKYAMQQMLSGKALGLGLETINFIFEINGINHIDAQQITRQRIGVTFSAQCTGDRFLNHNDVLVEESIAQDSELLENFIDTTLRAKMSYAEMVDSQKVSEIINLPEDHVISMLMVIGKQTKPAMQRGGQLSLDKIVFTDKFT